MAAIGAYAQFDAQFSQYWALPNYYNAGSVGYTGKLNLLGASKLQWVGMPNAPKSFFVAADMPLRLFKKDHGVGITLYNETMGMYKDMSMHLQYAYKLKLFGGLLGIGIQLGLFDQAFDPSDKFIPESDDHNQTDPGIPEKEVRGMAFDMAFGLFYSLKGYYAGLSATHLTEPVLQLDDNTETYIGRLYYLMGGCNIPFKNTLFELKPSFFVKTNFQMVQAELTARLTINKMFWGGLSYRWKDAVVLMVGAEIKGFRLGYAYDWVVSPIGKASSGSHEFFVSYGLKIDFSDKNKHKHKSIRIL